MPPPTGPLVALCGLVNELFGSVASSVAVLHESAGELEYVASAGPGADVVTGMRLPLGAGLAGFVASTGQAIAVADTRRDPRFAADVAQRTGHVPTSLLVVPVLRDDEVIGVVSILDRSSSRPDELERAGEIADVAAGLLAASAPAFPGAGALDSLDPSRRTATVAALSAVLALAGAAGPDPRGEPR